MKILPQIAKIINASGFLQASREYRNNKKYAVLKCGKLVLRMRIPSDNGYKFIPQPLDNEFEQRNEVYLSIAAILKNEALDIKEWIEYHKLIGVERFYLYDNESSDNVRDILQPYIDSGLVVYKFISGECMQLPAYRDAVYKYKNQTKWMAIIDLDEFIVPVGKNNLKDFLKDYEDYPAVVANWVMFDCNGFTDRPKEQDGLVIANYTRCMKNQNALESRLFKSIVNPRKVILISNPHGFVYFNGKLAVDENFNVNQEHCYSTDVASVNKIRINHYYSKSLEDYKIKAMRGFADSIRPREIFDLYLNFPETKQDYVIQKFLPKLKERMRVNK